MSESRAAIELVGRTVLIGVRCVGRDGSEVDRFQTFGTVETVGEQWISVRREGLAEPFGLPPAPALFEPARESVYTLHATGEEIEDPDFTVTLQVTVSDAESLLSIRGIGFSPE